MFTFCFRAGRDPSPGRDELPSTSYDLGKHIYTQLVELSLMIFFRYCPDIVVLAATLFSFSTRFITFHQNMLKKPCCLCLLQVVQVVGAIVFKLLEFFTFTSVIEVFN